MTNTAKEIQSSNGGSSETARMVRDVIAVERRGLRIEESHRRDSDRRVRRAPGPIDTLDHEALDVLRASLVAEQVTAQALTPGPIPLGQEVLVEELSGDLRSGLGQKLRDTARTVRAMLTLPI